MKTIEAHRLSFHYGRTQRRALRRTGPDGVTPARDTRRGGPRSHRPATGTGPRRAFGLPRPARASADGPGLHGIDLEACAGEIVGILGPNGAGKSTLLRVLTTGFAPTAGTLRLLGAEAIPPSRALRRRIGYAADGPVHFDALSGRDNAVFFARACGLDARAAERAVQGLLEHFDLARDAGRVAGQYSHGMRRKLLLVQALAHAPALIVLDEPTLGLDPPSRRSLEALLRQRTAAGATVMLATHDVLEAQRMCARVVFIHEGRLVLEGEPTDLLRRADAATHIEVELRAAAAPDLDIPGARTIRATADRIELRAASGGAILPRLCAALVEQGVAIRSIHLREPDLGDLFEQVTGASLSDATIDEVSSR